MMVAVKLVHIAAIAFWSAGLLALPFLFLERRSLEGDPLYALHRFVRSFYVSLVSPAAFIAIGSGIVLVFQREPYAPWFSAKLVLVGAMVLLHVTSGLLILNLFDPGGRLRRGHFSIVTILNASVVTGILALALGKPDLFRQPWFEDLFRPGALAEIGGRLIGWAI